MDVSEYRRLHGKIADRLNAKCEELQRLYAEIHTEQAHLVDSLNTLWRLEHDGPPPRVNEICVGIPVLEYPQQESLLLSGSNGNSAPKSEELKTRNDVIRKVVRKMRAGEIVTTQRVMEELQEEYPSLAQELTRRTTIISKVLRGLEKNGELLIENQGAGFNNPTVYRKADIRF